MEVWPPQRTRRPRLTQQADGGDDDELLLRRQLLDGQHVRAAAARTTRQCRDRIRHVPDAHKHRSRRCVTNNGAVLTGRKHYAPAMFPCARHLIIAFGHVFS